MNDMFKSRLVCMTIFWMAGFSACAGEAFAVLALGDSITAGGETFVCYREFLAPELRKNGGHFVGPLKDESSAHAGDGGKNTTFLRSKIRETDQAHPADIVLIHAGHNNFAKNKPVDRIIADTEAIIQTIRSINPKALVLLGQVITSGKLPNYSYIPELNRELESLATRLNERGDGIVVVNHADGFDWKTDTIGDKVHPNAAGAKKMAAKWMEALSPRLEKPSTNKRLHENP